MSEHMDVRARPLRGYAFATLGRAGPVMASSAGDRAGFIRAARDWGVLLFGYFLLDKHEPSRSEAERRRRPGGRRAGCPTYEKVTRCPAGARKLLILMLLWILMWTLPLDNKPNI
jgi:hypothetical protein